MREMDKIIADLDLRRFKERIDKSKLIPNEDGTYDYDGDLNLDRRFLNSFLEIPIRFKKITGNFSCSFNKLISLEGSPEIVEKSFTCSDNGLISLQYLPKQVNGYVFCSRNHLFTRNHQTNNKNIYFEFSKPYYDYYSFEIPNNVIRTVKKMTLEQKISELDFFRKVDIKSYEILLKILQNLGVKEIEKSYEMLEHTKSLDISNLV